jgi:hypothetical protein
MTTEPDPKTVDYRATLEIELPLGRLTWQFSTKADGQVVSVSPVVAVPVGPPAERD